VTFTSLVFIFCALSCKLFAQVQFDIAKAEKYTLKLSEETFESSLKIPFTGIIVRDYRFDTTKLGYVTRTPKKVIFKENSSDAFTKSMSGYFSNIFDPSSDLSLVIIIKNFWLQYEHNELIKRGDKVKFEDLPYTKGAHGGCIVDFEVFAQSGDSCKALFKLNHFFQLGRYKKKTLDDIVYIAFDSVVKHVQSLQVDELLKKKKSFGKNELHNAYNKRFEIPALKESPKRGIYLTFADFLKNNVSHTDFIMKPSKRSGQDAVYINGGKDLLLEYWAFFDGKDYYLRLGYDFYRMIRQNNTFDLMGEKKMTSIVAVPGTLANTATRANAAPTIVTALLALQVNMETGEAH
jgi:hypothetical protein